MFSYYLAKIIYLKSNESDLLKILPYVHNDEITQIKVCQTIAIYLENLCLDEMNTFINTIILQCILSWIQYDKLDLKWHCVNLLIKLSKYMNIDEILKIQLIRLIDTDNFYIKNLIQNSIKDMSMDDDLYNYIKNKCSYDHHFVVRKVNFELFDNKK